MKQSKQYLILLLLWSIPTLINLNKAFHIDDTFHLEAAQWIAENPLRPLSGSINWNGLSEPIHHFNQPPLFFYLIAIFGESFSYNEFPLHFLLSIFTGLVIYFSYKLSKIFTPSHPLVTTALITLNPALILNQNLMVDIPLLACILGFTYYLQSQKTWQAALILSIGLLIKYTVLPLLIVLFVFSIKDKNLGKIILSFIPVLVLSVWSIWNYSEYGSLHLAGRPVDFNWIKPFKQLISFIITLGSLSLFVWPIALVKLPAKMMFTLGATVIMLIVAYIIALENWILWALFLASGITFLLLGLRNTLFEKEKSVLWLSVLGLSSFMILFAPLMRPDMF